MNKKIFLHYNALDFIECREQEESICQVALQHFLRYGMECTNAKRGEMVQTDVKIGGNRSDE